jgi:hypothetical protein
MASASIGLRHIHSRHPRDRFGLSEIFTNTENAVEAPRQGDSRFSSTRQPKRLSGIANIFDARSGAMIETAWLP